MGIKMNKQIKKQKGFTLIELMIVVTIIGILASIAVPVYRDYTIRTKVGECASVFGAIKTDTSVVFSETGNLPGSLAGLPRTSNSPASFSGDYVLTMSIAGAGVVTCQLSGDSTLGPAADGTVVFTPTTTGGQRINWEITGSVDDKYLP
jgi:type IV pilus assembly protein PilA